MVVVLKEPYLTSLIIHTNFITIHTQLFLVCTVLGIYIERTDPDRKKNWIKTVCVRLKLKGFIILVHGSFDCETEVSQFYY